MTAPDGIHAEAAGEGPAIVLVHAGICDSPMPSGAYSHARDLIAVMAARPRVVGARGRMLGGRGGGAAGTIPDAAHLPSMERPELFDRLVADFRAPVSRPA